MTVESYRWAGSRLELLDQRLLPQEVTYRVAGDAAAVARAITEMVVRGAPAIGVVAAYGVVLAAQEAIATGEPLADRVAAAVRILANARPTSINLQWALDRMVAVRNTHAGLPPAVIAARLEAEATRIHRADLAINRAIGVHGAPLLEACSGVLTHCNTGALATAGFGTALGMIRQAWADGARFKVFANETRPFLQGARLTTWELMQDGIEPTLVVDSASALLMARGMVQVVVVGADRIAANGDVANKIGTCGLAIVAAEFGVPFYVAAPTSSLDPNLADGSQIPIEERDSREVTHLAGMPIAPEGVAVFNPAFDVTPGQRVTAIVTEVGILRPPYDGAVARAQRAGKAWPGMGASMG